MKAKHDAEVAGKAEYVNWCFTDASAGSIRALLKADPSANVAPLVDTLKEYVLANPPTGDLVLEIRDLEPLGVDLSFFPDPAFVVYPEVEEMAPSTEKATETAVAESAGGEEQADGKQAGSDDPIGPSPGETVGEVANI